MVILVILAMLVMLAILVIFEDSQDNQDFDGRDLVILHGHLPKMKPLLDSKAVCELLGVAPATLSRMVRSKKIPYVLLGTGKKKLTVRFRQEVLEQWLDRRSRGPVPARETPRETPPR
jgi:excisionase family DNA binding protein